VLLTFAAAQAVGAVQTEQANGEEGGATVAAGRSPVFGNWPGCVSAVICVLLSGF
jgi:hypothetical protein